MEAFSVSQLGDGLHIEGFPDAVKVVKLDGPIATRLADLALHKSDLDFADECLVQLNDSGCAAVVREALWRCAVVHFCKCFGPSKARGQLSAKKVFRGEPSVALEVFEYFHALRDKHLVHDENPYVQSSPAAVLNDGSKSYKVEKIICVSLKSQSLNQDAYANLVRLVRKARDWVVAEFDERCVKLSCALEAEKYTDLFAREALSQRIPTVDDVRGTRVRPTA